MAVVAFRTDASLEIGTGHVMRCLTLADALREDGVKCSFVCRPHQGHLLDLIAQRGHHALALPVLEAGAKLNLNGTTHAHWLGIDWAADAQDTQQVLSTHLGSEPLDWMVVDHYALDHRWEKTLRANTRRMMVIDDLADRHHDCDLLLDQNLGHSKKDYAGLIHPDATTLIGPQYALLRPEFAELRSKSLALRERNSQLKHLLITMGGVDKDNATGQVLDAIKACALPAELRITVVTGPHAPWLAQVRAQAEQMPWRTEVLVGVTNMAQLMADSDLAIGAAGGTAWERCSLGLPSLVLVLAKNQLAGAIALQDAGAAVVLKSYLQIAEFMGISQTTQFTNEMLTRLSHAAAAVTDGQGCVRAVDHMTESIYA